MAKNKKAVRSKSREEKKQRSVKSPKKLEVTDLKPFLKIDASSILNESYTYKKAPESIQTENA